ncbi:hypothetical protein GUJ93_ZPchr0013g37893 [Zizania palustris]|uniref:Uncharacterized protein n=1 Tax=Zizania palustris TaxID=103762 RepID=A0A8J5WSU1_ZIZPA|nr:hypothetical protein GUJ93_ZPchr0013g37893 [Zizania palustris]
MLTPVHRESTRRSRRAGRYHSYRTTNSKRQRRVTPAGRPGPQPTRPSRVSHAASEPSTPPAPTQREQSGERRRRESPAGAPMWGSLVSMLRRWPLDLGVPSLAALLPSSSAALYAPIRGWWHWRPEERLGEEVRQWPQLVPDVAPVVDTLLWSIISAIESVALLSMVCCFFLFCGCTL